MHVRKLLWFCAKSWYVYLQKINVTPLPFLSFMSSHQIITSPPLHLTLTHLLEYLSVLCISLTVELSGLVDLAQLLSGLGELALKVLNQLLVTSVFTIS